MAETQAQWYSKIRGWVPGWYFEQEKYAVAQFQAIAAIFAGIQQDVDDHFTATFVTESTAPVEDALGEERGKIRIAGEPDSNYAQRIEQITSQTDKPSIVAAVNKLLLTGTCQVFETPFDNPYCTRNAFCGRDNFLINARRNFFLIVIPRQTHAPYSFAARSYFCARAAFSGSLDSTSTVLQSMVAKLNSMKAYGVMYAVLEES